MERSRRGGAAARCAAARRGRLSRGPAGPPAAAPATSSAATPATSDTNRSPVSRSRQAPLGSCSAVSPQPSAARPAGSRVATATDAAAVERDQVIGGRAGPPPPARTRRTTPGGPGAPAAPGRPPAAWRPRSRRRSAPRRRPARRAAGAAGRSRPDAGCPGRPARSPTARCPGRRRGRRASSAAAASATASSTSRTARSGRRAPGSRARVGVVVERGVDQRVQLPLELLVRRRPRRRGARLPGGLLHVGVRPLARERPRADQVLPDQVGQRPVGQRVPRPAASAPARAHSVGSSARTASRARTSSLRLVSWVDSVVIDCGLRSTPARLRGVELLDRRCRSAPGRRPPR